MEKYLEILKERIIECLRLSAHEDKFELAKNLICRHTSDLLTPDQLVTETQIKKNFSSFVNKVLSTFEILDMSEAQYKAARKLVLSEIYGCQSLILKLDKNNK